MRHITGDLVGDIGTLLVLAVIMLIFLCIAWELIIDSDEDLKFYGWYPLHRILGVIVLVGADMWLGGSLFTWVLHKVLA